MGQLLQILDEKEDQLTRMRAAKESENASKEHELEEIARKIPGTFLVIKKYPLPFLGNLCTVQ